MFLEKLHQERDDLYAEAACFALSSDNGDIEDHVQKVIAAFEK